MTPTYRAMQVREPGVLEPVERPVPVPEPGEVLLAVEACGVCGADAADIDASRPTDALPRVPGHEVVGRIVALGPHVPPRWTIGQRVGVGRLGGHCNACPACRRGRFELCTQQPFVGSSCDGGYAELMRARATGLVAIPESFRSDEAAPILCAGLATFNALKKCGAEPGDTVAVLGVGGLGHMALQYAHRMGFRVVAIGRGSDLADDVRALGAHHYIDTRADDPVARLQSLGGAQAVLTTISHGPTVSGLLAGLAPQGRMVLLAGTREPITVSAGAMVVGERSLLGSITGTPLDSEKALGFSELTGAKPRIERVPFEHAQEAIRRLRSGEAKFRMVLSLPDNPHLPGALTTRVV